MSNKKHKKEIIAKKYIPNKNFEYFTEKYTFLIITLLIFIVFVQILQFALVYCDDQEIIINNFDRIKEFGNISNEFFRGYLNTNYYRPLINLSFIIDAQISGQSTLMYHLTNIILHLVSTYLLYLLFVKLKLNKTASLLSVLFFAVHPLIINAVVWIPGRNDVMFSLFLFISLLYFVKYISEEQKIFSLIIHFLSFFFAILSKETAIILPFIIIAYLLIFNSIKIFIKEKIIIPAIWFIIIAIWYILRSDSSLGNPVYSNGFYLFTNIALIPEIFAKLILSFRISVLPVFHTFDTLAGFVIIILLFIYLFFEKDKDKKLIVFGFLWFIIGILPGLFIRLLDYWDWNEYLECRAYFSIAGLMLIICSILSKKIITNRSLTIKITSGIIFLFSIITFLKSQNYNGPEAYYSSAVSDSPNKARFHYMLAKVYWKDKKLDLAEHEFKSAYISNQNYGFYAYNLAGFYISNKRYREAVGYFKYSNSTGYASSDTILPLAYCYENMGMLDSAIYYMKSGLSKNAKDMDYNIKLIDYNLIQSNYSEAEYLIRNLLTLNVKPGDISFYLNGLAEDYLKKKEDVISIWLLKWAVELDDKNSKPINNLFMYYYYVIADFTTAKIYALKLKALGLKIKPEYIEKLGIDS